MSKVGVTLFVTLVYPSAGVLAFGIAAVIGGVFTVVGGWRAIYLENPVVFERIRPRIPWVSAFPWVDSGSLRLAFGFWKTDILVWDFSLSYPYLLSVSHGH